MGQQQSTAAPTSSPAAEGSGESSGIGIKLFKFQQNAAGGQWDLYSANADTNFYDINEDSASKKKDWHLEIGSDIDLPVTDQFSVDAVGQRVTLAADTGAVYALKFPSTAAVQLFEQEYNSRLFENTFGVPFNAKNRDEKLGKDSILPVGGETAESREQWAEDMETDVRPVKEEVRRDRPAGQAGKEVHGVRLGAGDRSYLVRDKQIEVLKNVYGGVQSTGVSFDVTPPKGQQSFTPNKLMLMNRERRMNMLSPEGGQNLYHTDIETGKVVSEWSFKKDGVDAGMIDLANETRGAQLDDRDTFLGIGNKRIARWDMRAPEGVVQELSSPSVMTWDGGHDYKTNVAFNCMATSGDGYVVIGSDDGQIRLYGNKSLTRANTAIPGLGGPITAVDVTYDGKWVLATTKNYLMVVKTTYKDKGGKETNGFKSKMGARAPAPRLLRLKVEDQPLLQGAALRQGKFTWVTEAGRDERWIVASCGNHTVLWNFGQVKLAEPTTTSYGGLTTCTNYHLIKKQESVVDSVFVHDNYANSPGANDTSMVVVTKHQVWSLADDD
ncbi:hypothetical protein WJX79_002136 [Trebouxia sp. C0005]|nr:MAG: vacuolar import Vid27-related [Trebouxia sp. A1-2]